MAIRLGLTGDLTGTDAVAWSTTRGAPYTPSPLLHDGRLYVLTDNGRLSAFEPETGEPFYRQMRLPKPYNFKASPVGANGKLYLASENEDVVVVRMGDRFEVLIQALVIDAPEFALQGTYVIGRRVQDAPIECDAFFRTL